MTDTTAGDGGTQVIEPGAVAGALDADGQPSGAESAEDKAHRQGWRPKEQFKGDPTKWVDAATFLDRGEKYAPFIQAENKKLERALEKARADIESMKGQVKELGDFASKAAENAYKNGMRDAQADLEAAAAAGDVAGVRAATAAIVELGKEATAPAATKDGPDPEWKSAEAEWKAANPWFDGTEPGNKAMTKYALDVDAQLAEGEPSLTPAQRLAKVRKEVQAEFPEKFTNPNRDLPGAVETPAGGKPRNARTRSDLPADARAFMDKMVKAGTMTEAAYLKAYQW